MGTTEAKKRRRGQPTKSAYDLVIEAFWQHPKKRGYSSNHAPDLDTVHAFLTGARQPERIPDSPQPLSRLTPYFWCAKVRQMQEEKLEGRLSRPISLAEFVGQEEVRRNLEIAISSARGRGESIDHVLIHGPRGLGKSTLAFIIAHEMGSDINATTGPNVERVGDLAALLTNLAPKDVLFIDEIHRLPMVVQAILYPAMENFILDIVIGQGPWARSLKADLPYFTLVGATTSTGLLTPALRDRFGLILRVDFYGVEELAQITRQAAQVIGVEIDEEGAKEIARRSHGTPSIAKRLLKRVRDYAQVKADGRITQALADAALTLLEANQPIEIG
jgi:holliday junction DNA helicase RuvB